MHFSQHSVKRFLDVFFEKLELAERIFDAFLMGTGHNSLKIDLSVHCASNERPLNYFT